MGSGAAATIRVNGIDLFYEKQGAGDPLLLLAGFGCDHTFWDPVASVLAAKYTVICPDNRGSGQTSAPDGEWTVQELADDADALLGHLGIGSAHVAGHSLGGQIAQELALSHPARVTSLTLIATSARTSERMRTVADTAARMTLHAPAEVCCRAFLPWMFSEEFFQTPGAVETAMERVLKNLHPPTPRGLAAQSAAIGGFDASARLPSVGVPTLVLVGVDDILTPPARARDLAGRIRGAELLVLARGAHDLIHEAPRALSEAMLAFLAGVPPFESAD